MTKANCYGQSKHAPVKKSRGGTQPWPTSASAQHSTFAQAQRPMAGDAEEKPLTWGRRGNLQGPSTKPRTSPHPHRRGGSNAKRHNNDEGEEFLGPLVTAATTYAQIAKAQVAKLTPWGHKLGLASLMDGTARPLPFQLVPLSSSRAKQPG